MFGLFSFFRLTFFIYLGASILLIAVGYDYIGRYYPQIDLPYKERVFKLQNIILDKVDSFIDSQESDGTANSVVDGIKKNNPFK